MGVDEEPGKSLWVRMNYRAGTRDFTVGVCYKPPGPRMAAQAKGGSKNR